MSEILLEYKYQIECKFNNGTGEPEDIPIEQISGMIIDHSYDKRVMPIIILQLSVGKQLLDRIVLGKIHSTFILKVSKFADKDNTFVEDYIKDEFLYYLMDDINYTKEIEYTDEVKDRDDVLKSCKIGLINLRISNKNKRLFNNVYKNITNQCAAIMMTEEVGDLVFEPMLSYTYDELLVPPIDNIKDALDYLNERSSFYTSFYRYYMDFDRTYLLSSSGLGLETIDEPNNTVYISIFDPSEVVSHIEGMTLDTGKKAYNIPVDANYSRMYANNSAEKHFNKLYGISSSGKTKEIDVSINKSKVSTERKKIVRVPYENFGILDIVKNGIEKQGWQLTITKSNIDHSILTLNKQYVIKNYKDYSFLDGNFILCTKIETYQRQGEFFVSECTLCFRNSGE